MTSESFVDDLTMLSVTSEQLQKAMDVIQDLMSLTDQRFNEKKAEVLRFRHSS